MRYFLIPGTLLVALLLLGCVQQAALPAPPESAAALEDSRAPETQPAVTAPSGTIVAFGDSITAGFGVERHEAYPAVLERLLQQNGYNYSVINMGVSGDTSAYALERIDDVIEAQPDIVILQIGANDAKQLIDPDITRANIEGIVERLQEENITVVLAGNPVVRLPQWDFPEAFTSIYPAIAQEYNLTYIPFFLEGVIGMAEFNLDDGVHPAAAGHARIAQNTYPYVVQAIENRTTTS